MIVAFPRSCAVTTPPWFTVATDVFELDHAISRFVSAFPSASRGVAVTGTAAIVGSGRRVGPAGARPTTVCLKNPNQHSRIRNSTAP